MRGEGHLWQGGSLPFTPWFSSLEAYTDHTTPQPKTVQGFTTQSERQNPPNGPKTPQNLLLPLDCLKWSRTLLAHSAPHTVLFSLSFTRSWSFCLLFYLPGVLFLQIFAWCFPSLSSGSNSTSTSQPFLSHLLYLSLHLAYCIVTGTEA